MSDLEKRREAAYENMVRRMTKEPSFVPNPEFLRETKDPGWHRAAEAGRKPLCKSEGEARQRAAEVAREADKRQDEHRRRGGGR